MALVQAGTCSVYIRVTIAIKINLHCVGRHMCGLFSNNHDGMASIKIETAPHHDALH